MPTKNKKREKAKPVSNAKTKKLRKSRTTRAYRDNEREVQMQLKQFELTKGADIEDDDLDEFFFHGTLESLQTADIAKAKSKSATFTKQKYAKNTDSGQDDSATEIEESVDEADGDDDGETLTSAAVGITMDPSTFIQIEFDVLNSQWQRVQHKYADSQLLYKPTAKAQLQLKLQQSASEDSETNDTHTPATMRMMNRFIEEAKWAGEKIDGKFLKNFRMQRSFGLTSPRNTRHTLYRTVSIHQFRTIFLAPQRELLALPMRSFIKLHFQRLRITEHSHRLDEHRIAHELEDMYDEYMQNMQSKICTKLYATLQTERSIVQQLMQHEAEAGRSRDDLTQHLLNVQELREQYYAAEANQKRLLQTILNQWAELKLVRKQQQFQCTRFQLRLHVEQPEHITRAYQQWLERLEQDLCEIYRERLERYYKEKRLWTKQRKRGDAMHAQSKPPRKPSLSDLSEELKSQYALSFYEPEEPRVDIMRIYADPMYTDWPSGGGKQTQQLKSYYLKVYFDQKLVGQTRSYRMEPDLYLYMNETMGILLERHFPKHINLVLYEKNKLAAHKILGKITVPAVAKSAEYKLNIDGRSLEKTSNGQRTIAGNLYLRIVYDIEESHQPPVPGGGYDDIRCQATPNSGIVVGNQKVKYIKAKSADKSKTDKTCTPNTCTFQESFLQFCSMAELETNIRFRLLRSRYEQQNLRTKDLRFVPALTHEIAYDWEGQSEPVLDAGTWIDPIDMRKHRGKRFLRTLYEAIRNHCTRLDKVVESNEQLLVGDEPASWGGLLRALLLIFNPRRPLQATGSSASSSRSCQQIMLPDEVHNMKIVLNVVRASGIPVRSYHIGAPEGRTRNSDSSAASMFMHHTLVYSNVRPFIVFSYKDKLCRSASAEGSNPTWNEQLILSITGCVNELRDDIKISLFDEYIEYFYGDDPTDIHQRLQCNWLGEYRVPISSLIARRKLEGCFELSTPKVLLGYKRPTISSVTNISADSYPEIKEAVHLWCYLSVDPLYELPRLNTSNLECSELAEVRQHLQLVSMEMRQLQPQRFVEPLICTIEGKRVSATRLFEAIPLAIESGGEQLLDATCRFVALQNVLKNYDACMGYLGVWLDNKTILDVGWCAAKDLGVLLCNYMLTLGIKSWLVLGEAAPYGETAYVLFRHAESGEYMLVAPDTGKRYATRDLLCPLTSVRCIFEQNNIYYNIQREQRVSMTNFNLHDTSCWWPVFNKKNPAPIGGVQKLNYTHTVSLSFIQLRKNIEHKIMKKISSWRSIRKTIWNRAFQPRLLSILQQMETLAVNSLGNATFEEPKFSEELEQDFPNYRVTTDLDVL